MSSVVADISISLDGFSAGANDGPGNPMGDDGMRLHQWFFGQSGTSDRRDADVQAETSSRSGAVILGKRMFDNGFESWDRDNPWSIPAFVLSHDEREPLTRNGQTLFTFVADGIESALEQARAAAGGKDVLIGGGANTIQQFLTAGLLDEVQVHVVPVLFGNGIRLFDQAAGIELELARVVDSPAVTHIRYRIVK